jgi:hypothetical protein
MVRRCLRTYISAAHTSRLLRSVEAGEWPGRAGPQGILLVLPPRSKKMRPEKNATKTEQPDAMQRNY